MSKSAKVDLECNITGQPAPNVQWYKDAKLLTENARITMTSLKAGHSRLTFKNVSNMDSGTYQCFADNGVDVIQSSACFIRDGKLGKRFLVSRPYK